MPPDVIDYAAVARNLIRGEGYLLQMIPYHPGLVAGLDRPPEMHGLLRPFELVPLFATFGPDGEWAKIPSLAYVAGTSLLAFLVARDQFDTGTGWVAALLVLTWDELAFVAAFGADDVGAAFWSLLTIYCANRAMKSSSIGWAVGVGISAGFGVLEKVTCVLLPGVLLISILAHERARLAIPWRARFAIVALPATAAGLYVLRNYSAHGGPGFRFTSLEWLAKQDYSDYFAYYPERPSLTAVWSDLGAASVLQGIGLEVAHLGPMVAGNWLIMIGGLVSLLVLTRRSHFLALVSLQYSFLLIAVTCTAHHLQLRYLFGGLSFYVVAVSGGMTTVWKAVRQHIPRRWVQAATIAAVASVALAGGSGLYSVLGLQRSIAKRQPVDSECPDAALFIRERVARGAPILTADPWFTVWTVDRPAVNAPTNGADAIAKIAKHYGTRWALVGPQTVGGADLVAELPALEASLRPRLVHESGACRVFELHW